MPNEHVLELFMRVLEGVVIAPATSEDTPLSDLNDSFVSHSYHLIVLSLLSFIFSRI